MGYGTVIREFRTKAGMSQEQLGERVGVSRSAVYDWETEKYPPTDSKNIAALERAFGLDVGHLYILIHGNPPKASGSDVAATDSVSSK